MTEVLSVFQKNRDSRRVKILRYFNKSFLDLNLFKSVEKETFFPSKISSL